MSNHKPLKISENLEARLTALARQTGHTLDELATSVLKAHADARERDLLEQTDDERRWQRYLETGQTLSLDRVRKKLHRLADQAARTVESQ